MFMCVNWKWRRLKILRKSLRVISLMSWMFDNQFAVKSDAQELFMEPLLAGQKSSCSRGCSCFSLCVHLWFCLKRTSGSDAVKPSLTFRCTVHSLSFGILRVLQKCTIILYILVPWVREVDLLIKCFEYQRLYLLLLSNWAGFGMQVRKKCWIWRLTVMFDRYRETYSCTVCKYTEKRGSYKILHIVYFYYNKIFSFSTKSDFIAYPKFHLKMFL